MPFDTEAKDIRGAGRRFSLDRLPDECPRCHSKIIPLDVHTIWCGDVSGFVGDIEKVFRCVNEGCQRFFIAIYELVPTSHSSANPLPMALAALRPVEPTPPEVADLVANLSPSFTETYSQALEAERQGLDQLAGIGLRKAIEFLVKDFAISRNPAKHDEIVAKPLAACIRDFIEDPNVAATTKRAVWLGNDETHYVRRWADRDIGDLKILIRLTLNWLENILLTEKYIVEMPE